MARRRRITIVLVVVLVASVLAPAAGAGGAPAGTVAEGRQGSACDANVVFFGARGSGQPQAGESRRGHQNFDGGTGLGPQVYGLYRAIDRKVGRGVDVDLVVARYPARGVQSMANPSIGIVGYLGGLDDGVDDVFSEIWARRQCRNQVFVLAGYSQGAMVMHRVLRRLEARRGGTAVLGRMAGAILLADGDAVRNDNVSRFGTANADAIGVGSATPGWVDRPFSRSVGARVHSVCMDNDIVCDWNPAQYLAPAVAGRIGLFVTLRLARAAMAVHTSDAYRRSAHTAAAEDAVAVSVRRYTIPSGPQLRVSATVGQPTSTRLTALHGAAIQPSWRVAAGSAMPTGLRLRPNGRITGTPARAGTFTVEVTVANRNARAPWNTPLRSRLTITIVREGPPVLSPTEQMEIVVERLVSGGDVGELVVDDAPRQSLAQAGLAGAFSPGLASASTVIESCSISDVHYRCMVELSVAASVVALMNVVLYDQRLYPEDILPGGALKDPNARPLVRTITVLWRQ